MKNAKPSSLALFGGTIAKVVVALVGGAATGFALAATPILPAAVIACGGEPQPPAIECKTWKCTNNVWTLSTKTNGSSCTDGNSCSGPDTCTNGICIGPALPPTTTCNDSNPCTSNDHCDGAKHCVATLVKSACCPNGVALTDYSCCIGGAPVALTAGQSCTYSCYDALGRTTRRTVCAFGQSPSCTTDCP